MSQTFVYPFSHIITSNTPAWPEIGKGDLHHMWRVHVMLETLDTEHAALAPGSPGLQKWPTGMSKSTTIQASKHRGWGKKLALGVAYLKKKYPGWSDNQVIDHMQTRLNALFVKAKQDKKKGKVDIVTGFINNFNAGTFTDVD